MKKLSIALALSASVCVAACNGEPDGYTANPADATNAVRPGGNAAPDMGFVNDVATSGMKEVRVSQLAQTKATNASVKAFAEMMVKDHSSANDRLRQALGTDATRMSPDEDDINDAVARLEKLSGAEFDKEYIDMMVNDHQDAVSKLDGRKDDSGHAQVHQWVTSTLPAVRAHLQRAQEIQRELNKEG